MIDPTWESFILQGGTKRRVHVLVSELQNRIKAGPTDHRPVWAVRSSVGGPVPYSRTRLYRHIEFLGPAYGIESFDNPLPGTKGRGVAVIETDQAIRVWFDGPVKTLILTDETVKEAA